MCSESWRPLVAWRFWRIFATSGRRLVRRSADEEAAEAVRVRSWESGCHSACQEPAARWSSCSAAEVRVARRPGACLVQLRTAIAATGLRLWGMADEPPVLV